MPSRRGRSRISRQVDGESRDLGSDEDFEQQSVPLRRRTRQAEVEVEDISQQSNRKRFKPREKKFKRRSNSSSSGSVSSGGSGSGGVMCGQCGGRHMTSQCRGVQGPCHRCGQPGHFASACPLPGGQPSNQSQKGSAGGSSQTATFCSVPTIRIPTTRTT
ncbi:hypothetical protein F511_21381 [Dorcoceras hygrometricum]|uniref:CCHC-type domain-containing protein n=1 Tax=Dorcoceras hygrometricum TaxID=472368 RepID=A0A2Z7D7Y2_9LAMI|nr:hypothetical protein F511_21381 [Dorcoceras hygrometricum]